MRKIYRDNPLRLLSKDAAEAFRNPKGRSIEESFEKARLRVAAFIEMLAFSHATDIAHEAQRFHLEYTSLPGYGHSGDTKKAMAFAKTDAKYKSRNFRNSAFELKSKIQNIA
jgi:hypothetical protein